MYKGIGPNKLGSPLKQTTKKYPDLPQGLKSDKVKKDYKQFEGDYASSQYAMAHQALNRKATGGLKPAYPETFFMGGPVLKGVGNLFKGAQPAFNLAKSTAPAWQSAATTVAGAVGDDIIIGGIDYLVDDDKPSNNKNKKNKK